MRDIEFKIKSNEKIAEKTYELVLECEKNQHGITNPGQFINIKIDGYFLRRPISICSWEDDEVTVIYKTVGRGTETLSTYETGRTLTALTALGNGYDLKGAATFGANNGKSESNCSCGCSEETDKEDLVGERPLLIGGGAGVPPMYGLCRSFINIGKKPVVLLGFNNESEAFYIDEFKALGVDVIVATADGSIGIKGFVTDALKDIDFTYFCTCGPLPMLRALNSTIDENIGGQLSFEERMGCGFGACMGCSCETKYGYKRICKDGPVLERGEIIW